MLVEFSLQGTYAVDVGFRHSSVNEVKDDMQKLLDELSGIKKEPAQ